MSARPKHGALNRFGVRAIVIRGYFMSRLPTSDSESLEKIDDEVLAVLT